MIGASTAATREAARVAQVGYTAVIDRMTPALDLETVAANVSRSVGSAGGAPAEPQTLADAWAPIWRRGAVSLFEPHRTQAPFGTGGTLAFGITVEADGALGALIATAVLHELSPQLRADGSALSGALLTVISGTRPGVSFGALTALLVGGTTSVSAPVAPVLLRLDGTVASTPDPVTLVTEADTIAVGAIARTADGPIAFQTTVHVSAEGAERLDAFPLRLIELR